MKKSMLFRSSGLVITIVIISFIISLTGCAPAASQGPIRIGILAPYTGVGADYGPIVERSVRLAFEEAGWKVANRTIELYTADEDSLDPSVTLERTKALVEQDKVDIIIGPIFGSSQQAIAPYIAEQSVLDISVHNGSWDLKDNGHFVIWPGTDYATARPIGAYVYQELGYKTMTVMAPDYIYGHTLMAGPSDLFKELGGQVVQEQWVPLTTVDMLPYVTALDPNAEVIMVWLLPDNFVNFLSLYHSMNLSTPVMMIHSLREGQLQELGPQIDGFYCLTDYTWRNSYPKNQAFVASFEKAYSEKPDQTDASAYSSASIALAGLKATNGDATFDVLRKAILGLKLETPLGNAVFTKNGFAVTDRQITQVKSIDGHWVYEPIKTYTAVNDPRDQ